MTITFRFAVQCYVGVLIHLSASAGAQTAATTQPNAVNYVAVQRYAMKVFHADALKAGGASKRNDLDAAMAKLDQELTRASNEEVKVAIEIIRAARLAYFEAVRDAVGQTRYDVLIRRFAEESGAMRPRTPSDQMMDSLANAVKQMRLAPETETACLNAIIQTRREEHLATEDRLSGRITETAARGRVRAAALALEKSFAAVLTDEQFRNVFKLAEDDLARATSRPAAK